MSLLEDVFLEDEANEAQELERVIEGDEFDDRPRSRSDSDDNSEREGEAEEDKKRVDPASTKTRRVIKNPRFILNPARLTGPRGIQVIPEHFKDFKFKGKGHEKEDLDLVLKKLEHWAYRLYPKFKFEDCLKKIETLGKKRPVMVHLHKIRTDQYLSEETVVQRDSSDDEALREAPDEAPAEDEFDKLLKQQIELARSTPAPGFEKKGRESAVKENRTLIMPKVISSPSISDEQRERILKSRKLAEERRLARLKASSTVNTQNHENITNNSSKINNSTNTQEELGDNEINKTNSDDGNDVTRNFDNIVNTPSSSENVTCTRGKVSSDDEIDRVSSDKTGNVLNNGENHVAKVRKVKTNVIDSSDEDDDLMEESMRADLDKVNNDKNHYISNGLKQGPNQTDGNTADDDKILEIDINSNKDQENTTSSDEDDIVVMNESIRADVHKADSDKVPINAIKEGPKQIGVQNIINDDVILEIDGNSQENVHSAKSVTLLMNKEDNVKQDITEVDRLTSNESDVISEIDNNDKGFHNLNDNNAKTDEVNDIEISEVLSEIDSNDKGFYNLNDNNAKTGEVNDIEISDVISEIDNKDKGFHNLNDNNAKTDEVNDIEMNILTENNTIDHETCNKPEAMANIEKSAKVISNSQEIDQVQEQLIPEAAKSREEISNEKGISSEKAVENNIDDLMDVEFDDDF